MNLKYHNVTVTPELVNALHKVLSEVDVNTREYEELNSWVGYVKQSLYETWVELPDGDHLKAAYALSVWAWDDQDLASIHPVDFSLLERPSRPPVDR